MSVVDVILSSVETMCGGGAVVGGGGPLLAEVTRDLCSLVIIFLSSRELLAPAASIVKRPNIHFIGIYE